MNRKHRNVILLTAALLLGAAAFHLSGPEIEQSSDPNPLSTFHLGAAQCNMTDTYFTASLAFHQAHPNPSDTIELAFHPPGTRIKINTNEQALASPQHPITVESLNDQPPLPPENITITPTDQFDHDLQFTINMTAPRLTPTPPTDIRITIHSPRYGTNSWTCN